MSGEGPPSGTAPGPRDGLRFAEADLPRLRETVREAAAGAGLGPRRAADFVLAVHELAVNSVMHGGGSGTLRLWVEGDALFADVADQGEFARKAVADGHPGEQPRTQPEGGLGLWIVRRACDSVEIIRDPERGTVVRVAMDIRPDATAGPDPAGR